MKFTDLIQMKKSNFLPKEGDVFILKPKENLYCFGRVIQTKVNSKDSFINGMNLIYIYDFFSKTKDLPEMLEKKDILIVEVVNHQLWRKGFAETIGYSKVTNEDLENDIAFWNIMKKEYVNINGDRFDHVPKYAGMFGLGSYGSIGRQIQKILGDRGI